MAIKRYGRQSSIINIAEYQDNTISIVGCGAIGSTIAVALAKMGLENFELWDFDSVEEHNLPNQFFFEDQVGVPKVTATSDNMLRLNKECKIQRRVSFNEGDKLAGNIVIASVDKMDVRKKIFDSCKKDKNCQLYIDTRMGGLQGQIYFVDMEDKAEIENYEKTLFSNEEAVRERCTERAIIFTVFGMASIVCCQIMKALKGEDITNYLVIDFKEMQLV